MNVHGRARFSVVPNKKHLLKITTENSKSDWNDQFKGIYDLDDKDDKQCLMELIEYGLGGMLEGEKIILECIMEAKTNDGEQMRQM